MEHLKTSIITLLPSSPAFYFAVESPTALTIITSIVLPIVFFIVSKTVDVLVQLYLKRNKK